MQRLQPASQPVNQPADMFLRILVMLGIPAIYRRSWAQGHEVIGEIRTAAAKQCDVFRSSKDLFKARIRIEAATGCQPPTIEEHKCWSEKHEKHENISTF